MDIKLELLFRDDRVYLNFWHPENPGDDGRENILCEVKGGALFRFLYSTEECEALELEDVDFDPFAQEEVSLAEFVQRIRRSMNVDKEQRMEDERMKNTHDEFMKDAWGKEFQKRVKEQWDEMSDEEKEIWKDPEQEGEGECR